MRPSALEWGLGADCVRHRNCGTEGGGCHLCPHQRFCRSLPESRRRLRGRPARGLGLLPTQTRGAAYAPGTALRVLVVTEIPDQLVPDRRPSAQACVGPRLGVRKRLRTGRRSRRGIHPAQLYNIAGLRQSTCWSCSSFSNSAGILEVEYERPTSTPRPDDLRHDAERHPPGAQDERGQMPQVFFEEGLFPTAE